ncbi:MAG: hypothetical protein ACREAB_10395, partial [Blastocatellia bacterium]
QLRRNDFATAGLEIKYTGAPGSVIASASSVSQSGNHVFALPMKDPQGGLSSTGGYPWFINGSSSTVVFIKNTTNEPRTFTIDLVYAGGQWGSGLKTIAPGQTFKLDVREVRDSQMKGSAGNTMPLDAVVGHVNWSVRGKGGNKTLIGRAQTVDFSNGLASTYECQQCCPRNFFDSRLEPGIVSGLPGDQQQFLPVERTEDCFGNIWDWDGPYASVSFGSDDYGVATINSGGLGTALYPGSTSIRASWESVRYFKDPNGTCLEEPAPTDCASSCTVQAANITINSVESNHAEIHGGETATITANISVDATLQDKEVKVNFVECCKTGTIVTGGFEGPTPGEKTLAVTKGNHMVQSTIKNTSASNNGSIKIQVSISSTLTAQELKVNGSPKESPSITLKPAN